jgi:uncharacterized protein
MDRIKNMTKQLDQATQVKEYRIKDIDVKMNKDKREVVFVKYGVEEVISIEDLKETLLGCFGC